MFVVLMNVSCHEFLGHTQINPNTFAEIQRLVQTKTICRDVDEGKIKLLQKTGKRSLTHSPEILLGKHKHIHELFIEHKGR